MTTARGDAGTVVTVDGPIEPGELGTTITHEHLFVDFADPWFSPPEDPEERRLAEQPVTMENRWYVCSRAFSNRDNLQLDSVAVAIDEVERFRRAGGDTIVEVTPKGLDGDPLGAREVARETGINIVQGTAYYIRDVHPERVDTATETELEAEFVSDVREGIDDTDVRAGIIGEIGLSGQIHPAEEKVLRAAARAARRTGAPLTIHPPGRTPESQRDRTYPTSRWALHVLDIVEETGLGAERVVMDHMDRTLYEDLDSMRELADRGPFLEFDLWGADTYLPQYGDAYPSDQWRVETVAALVDEGYVDQLLFSQDIGEKTSLTQYGGFGYAHVLRTATGRLRDAGLTDEDLDAILETNPRSVLTFAEPG
ncbi:MAG: amidohydrolase family protein [Halobacteriales archaeon]|nr:amidohydrolase family protein [Halobacteriales archaeon]